MFNVTSPQKTHLLAGTILTEPDAGWVSSPSDLYSGWVVNGSNIEIPLTTFSEFDLTSANADGTTGDARQVLLSLCGKAFEWWNDLTTEPEAAHVKLTGSFQTSGNLEGNQKTVFTFTFYHGYPGYVIADEPD